MLNRETFLELARAHGSPCVSLYMPTDRRGETVLNHGDSFRLKSLLRDIETKLSKQAYPKEVISQLTGPIRERVNVRGHGERADGVALFISSETVHEYLLPISFEPCTYISNQFYLLPLLPLFENEGEFFLLALELGKVCLYRFDRYQMVQIYIEEHIPSKMEDEVGRDHVQKSLQYRSQVQGHREALFHGHGEGKEDRKLERKKFFKAIDKGLAPILRVNNLPLLLAGLKEELALYRSVNSYGKVLAEELACHPSDLPIRTLHQRAWKELEPRFHLERSEKTKEYLCYRDTDRTSERMDRILPAGVQGRIQTLFLRTGSDLWGIYDPVNNHLKAHKREDTSSVSIYNMLAIETLRHEGTVYLLDPKDMPAPDIECCAIFRN